MASACLLFAPFMNAIPLDRPTTGTFGIGVGLPGLMRKCTHARVWATFFVSILLLHSATGESLRLSSGSDGRRSLREHQNHMMSQELDNNDFLKGPFGSGSSLPDCSHACGPCFPCKRVIVSYKCSIAESCPIVYRCLCKGKYYHVPSN